MRLRKPEQKSYQSLQQELPLIICQFPIHGGLALAPNGYLYATSLGNGDLINVFSPTGAPAGTLGVPEYLDTPGVQGRGLTFDSNGDLFEADSGTGRILEYANNGGTLSDTPTVFTSGLSQPYGIFDVVPEPGDAALLPAGLLVIALRSRRRSGKIHQGSSCAR
jgi:sugar lactone lactonase YvrE